jgi:sugar lactone lactonase YvrE
VALWDGALYVASTTRGLLVRIPIEADGSAGAAEVVAGDDSNECEPDALFGMDGIAVASDGSVYAALVLQNQLVRIDPADGSHEMLLTAEDGLHNPASLAFGTTEGDTTSLYITNYAVLPPEPEDSPGPAVIKVDVGVEGAPLP